MTHPTRPRHRARFAGLLVAMLAAGAFTAAAPATPVSAAGTTNTCAAGAIYKTAAGTLSRPIDTRDPGTLSLFDAVDDSAYTINDTAAWTAAGRPRTPLPADTTVFPQMIGWWWPAITLAEFDHCYVPAPGTLKVRMVDAAGTPIPGWSVGAGLTGQTTLKWVTTGADGVATIIDLAPGNYHLREANNPRRAGGCASTLTSPSRIWDPALRGRGIALDTSTTGAEFTVTDHTVDLGTVMWTLDATCDPTAPVGDRIVSYTRAAAPAVITGAYDTADHDQVVTVGGQLSDKVDYTGLTVGETHTASLVWMDADTGQPTGLTAAATFVPAASAGTVDVGPVTVTAVEAGKKLVAFETITDSLGAVIAEHKDLQSVTQTVDVEPVVINTSARDLADGDNVAVVGAQLVDKVDYTGLTAGNTYTLALVWMDADTAQPTGLTAAATFMPAASAGTVDVGPVTVTAAEAGKKLVAFETLRTGDSTGGDVLAEHKDISSVAQTVTVEAPAPTTTVPVTTIPVTTVPVTTIPTTSIPATTMPVATVPTTPVPADITPIIQEPVLASTPLASVKDAPVTGGNLAAAWIGLGVTSAGAGIVTATRRRKTA